MMIVQYTQVLGMNEEGNMYDTIILGNGIAGMSAAIYAKRAGLNFKIIGGNRMKEFMDNTMS